MIGFSAARRKSAQADIARCKRLGIKRRGGRRSGPLWVTDRMAERAMLIARELGVWGLPSRDARLVWSLLRAGKDEALRPKAQAMLKAAEIAAAKRVLEDLGVIHRRQEGHKPA